MASRRSILVLLALNALACLIALWVLLSNLLTADHVRPSKSGEEDNARAHDIAEPTTRTQERTIVPTASGDLGLRTMRFRVIDAAYSFPIGDVTIDVVAEDPLTPIASGITNDRGFVAIVTTPRADGTVSYSARCPGYDVLAGSASFGGGQQTVDVGLTLKGSGTLSGRIERLQSREPLEMAEVSATYGGQSVQTISKADGSYGLMALRGGVSYSVSASRVGFVGQTSRVEITASSRCDFALAASNESMIVVVVPALFGMLSPYTLTAELVDDRRSMWGGKVCLTNGTGSMSIPASVAVSSATAMVLRLPTSDSAPTALVMNAAGKYTVVFEDLNAGRVRCKKPDGAMIGGATIEVVWPSGVAQCDSDADGVFVLMAGRAADIAAVDLRCQEGLASGVQVPLSAVKSDVTVTDVVFHQFGGAILVIGRSPSDVVNVVARTRNEQRTYQALPLPDDRSRVRVRLPAGRADVFEGTRCISEQGVIVPEAGEVTIDLRNVIRGAIRGTATHGSEIMVYPADSGIALASAVVGADRTFRINELHPGTVRVTSAFPQGGALAKIVDITAGVTTDVGDFDQAAVRRTPLVLVGSDGEPLRNTRVTVDGVPSVGGRPNQGVTDDNGSIVTKLPPTDFIRVSLGKGFGMIPTAQLGQDLIVKVPTEEPTIPVRLGKGLEDTIGLMVLRPMGRSRWFVVLPSSGPGEFRTLSGIEPQCFVASSPSRTFFCSASVTGGELLLEATPQKRLPIPDPPVSSTLRATVASMNSVPMDGFAWRVTVVKDAEGKTAVEVPAGWQVRVAQGDGAQLKEIGVFKL